MADDPQRRKARHHLSSAYVWTALGRACRFLIGAGQPRDERRRLESAYTWVVLVWACMVLGVLLPPLRHAQWVPQVLLIAGQVFSLIALLVASYGALTRTGYRRRYVPAVLLAAVPVGTWILLLLMARSMPTLY